MLKNVWLWLVLSSCALGQVAYSNHIWTAAGNVPFGANANLMSVPNAKISVCQLGTNCTVIPVFNDQAMTSPITQPFTADAKGNFTFYAAPGTYQYVANTATGQYLGAFPFTLGSSSSVYPKNVSANVNNWQNPLTYGQGSANSANTTTITGHIGNGTISLSSAADFANTQGVLIAHAGPACGAVRGNGCTAPPTPSISTAGTAGSTSYRYALACIDGLGGVGVAGTASTISTGNATLSGVATGTQFSGNYNVVTWNATTCSEVAIYRNSVLIATEYSAPTGTMTYNDLGVAAWTNRDIPSAPVTTALNDNYVGFISGILGSAATVTPTLGISVSGATMYHSDTPLIQAAINASSFVNIPPGTYLINYPLNYSAAGSAVSYGISGSIQGNAVLLMDTGDIGLDVTGDDNIVLSGFTLQAGATNPSTIALYCSRDTTLHADVAQNVLTDHLILSGFSNSNALGGRGGVGFYNHACEIQHNYDNQFQADRWMVLTATNIDHVSSPFDANDDRGFNSMSQVDVYSANGGGGVAAELENTYTINFLGGYLDGGFIAAHPWAFEVDGGQSGRLTVDKFRVEGKGGLLDVATNAVVVEPYLSSDVYRAPPMLTLPQIRLNGGASLQDADMTRADDYGGSSGSVSALVDQGTGSGCAVARSKLRLGIYETVGTCQTTGLGNEITGTVAYDNSLPPTYQLTAASSATWVKLGTWISSTPGIGASLGIKMFSGTGFNAAAGNQALADIVVRNANGLTTAPNLSGASMFTFGAPAFTGLKVVATGGSTSVTNQSWDVYVQEAIFANGNYSISKAPNDQWINSNTVASDPGSASSTVVVGTINQFPVFNTSTPTGTCTSNGYVPVVINGVTVHIGTCN